MTAIIERLFCPACGHDGAYDCTGEDDWVCANPTCDKSLNSGNSHPFITPLRERDVARIAWHRKQSVKTT